MPFFVRWDSTAFVSWGMDEFCFIEPCIGPGKIHCSLFGHHQAYLGLHAVVCQGLCWKSSKDGSLCPSLTLLNTECSGFMFSFEGQEPGPSQSMEDV